MQALGQGHPRQLAAGHASAVTSLKATGSAIGTTGFTTGQAAAAGMSSDFQATTSRLLASSSRSQLVAASYSIISEPFAAFQSVGLDAF